jgi:hypothetical protein
MIRRAQKNTSKYNKNVKQCRRVRRTKEKTDGSREKQTQQLQIWVHLSVELQKQQLGGLKIWQKKFKPSRIWTKRIAMEEGGREPTTQHHAVHTYIHTYIHVHIRVCMHVRIWVCICLLCILLYCHLYAYIHHWVVLNTFFWKYFKLKDFYGTIIMFLMYINIFSFMCIHSSLSGFQYFFCENSF